MVEEPKAYQVLVEMFDLIERATRDPPRECFNKLIRFFADCMRIRSLPDSEHGLASRLLPLTKPFLDAYYQEPQDHFATLFSRKKCANSKLGQIMTPRWIAQYINKEAIGPSLDDEAKNRLVVRVLDPCTGTGVFLVEAARMFPQQNLFFFGVELDIDLYRAALVNLRLAALGRPYFILRANALIVDIRSNSPNWRFANTWNPPDWERDMTMDGGGNWQDWRETHGQGGEEPPIPQREATAVIHPDDPLQPRLF